MRFHDGSFESLARAAKVREAKAQCLFLVADVNNPKDENAVMLHDGVRKLGYVAATQAPAVKAILEGWKRESGNDEVAVVTFGEYVSTTATPRYFQQLGNIKMRGVYRVNERFARKFATKQLKS